MPTHGQSRRDFCKVITAGAAVAARVVLLLHQQVQLAFLRQQADRLAVAEALLAAVAVLIAVLAHLQVAGVIDDLADDGRGLGRKGLPLDRG